MATADLQPQTPMAPLPIHREPPKSKLGILLPALATMINAWGEHDYVVDTAKEALEQIERPQTSNSEDS